MRFIAVLAAALLLAGCTDTDWARWTRFDAAPEYPDGAMPADVAPTAVVPPRAVATAPMPVVASNTAVAMTSLSGATESCARAARERSGDVAMQGFDEDLQRQVYDTTYADCMKWAARGSVR